MKYRIIKRASDGLYQIERLGVNKFDATLSRWEYVDDTTSRELDKVESRLAAIAAGEWPSKDEVIKEVEI